MVKVTDDVCRKVGARVSAYKKFEMVATAASLLTLPKLQANAIRLETLVHLAVANASGQQTPNRTSLIQLLNEDLGNSQIATMEDPAEDVLVSNISTNQGGMLLFNGIWEANDYYTQLIFEVLDFPGRPPYLNEAKGQCLSLLKLSDAIAKRRGLNRNDVFPSADKAPLKIPNTGTLEALSKSVVFDESDLESLGISSENLEPFVLEDTAALRDCDIACSLLTQKPILKLGGLFVVALPNAIGISIRYLIVQRCEAEEQLSALGAVIARIQLLDVLNRGLFELKKDFKPVGFTSNQPDSIVSNDEILLTDHSGYFLHVLVLHDGLSGILDSGFNEFVEHTKEAVEGLASRVETVANYARSGAGFQHGDTLFVFGGLGRGIMLGFDHWPDDWGCHFLPISDLNLLTRSRGDPLKEFLACMHQKSWIQDKGLKLNNINGDLNYFGYWRDNDFKCSPDEQPIENNVMFSLFTDFTLPIRKELRLSTDRHASQTPSGVYQIVERLTQSSYYREMREAPVYVSLDDIRNGRLRGVIEKPGINFWLGVDNDNRSIPDSMAYTWWSGLIELCQSGIGLISESCAIQNTQSVEVILSFCDLVPIKEVDPTSEENRGFVTHEEDENHCVRLQSNFLANFVQVENIGERLLLGEVFRSVLEQLESRGIQTGLNHEQIVDSLFSDNGIRLIHAFRGYDEINRLIFELDSEPKLIRRYLFPFIKIRMANKLSLQDTKTDSEKATKRILNGLVEGYWQEIREIIRNLNARSLVESCFRQLHRIQADKVQWNQTARAVQAIYSKYDDVVKVAQQRESERNLTSLCLRTIIEIAVCEAPESEGEEATPRLVENLVDLVAVMIEIGADSDAVHSGFSAPRLSIEPSGFFETGTDAYRDVVIPYLSGYFHRQFNEAIDSYDDLYREYTTSESEGFEEDDDFNRALSAEFGLSEGQVFNIGKCLLRAHLEHELPICVWNKDELVRYLGDAGAGDADTIARFLDAFSLPRRGGWDDFSGGYNFKDIAPWKFKRRLSCLCRPIIPVKSNQFLTSAFILRQGFGYFLDLARDGLFIPEFFKSAEMRSYVGRKTAERGLWFNEVVAQKLTEGGYETLKELDMSSFGKPELGDVDVIGIKGGRITLIECKNLQMAKTISEIADICNRFKGEEKDELAKHLARVGWINANRNLVSRHLGMNRPIDDVKQLLVTNTEIPIKYKEGLPIESGEIVSIAELQEELMR